ncbi:MAG: methyltransferase domain-containing protein [Candidatus Zixiibacteriota bacterium]|nr:MAG: methyltransferase domain-containing protein [candidate division Zixibacteria bacterium]
MTANNRFLEDFMRMVDTGVFTPSLHQFLVDFLSIERVRRYGEQYVISTFIPPFPGKAFARFMETFFGAEGPTGVQAVDLAVTNACMFNCRHCYNAGRQVADPVTEALQRVVARLQELGAFLINFTGGEPCLRSDLVEICGALNDDTCAIISTTGYGLSDNLAGRLRERGVYAISVSLDSGNEQEHDRIRGVRGAFRIALRGIETALEHGFYTYTCVVPSKHMLEPDNFASLVELNRRLGVAEIQILEPAPAGKLLHSSSLLEPSDFQTIRDYMAKYNSDENGPAISSFAHLEAPEFFGCGAGFSHIYIDGTGEVSPCNMMPVTYGNSYSEDLQPIIERMQSALKAPCRTCRAFAQREHFQTHVRRSGLIPSSEAESIPPFNDGLPGFYEVLTRSEEESTGNVEIIAGYSQASETYDDYWLSVASGPIDDLFERLSDNPGATAIDCGCGTGYATAMLARSVAPGGRVIGIDLTEAMVARARERLENAGLNRTEFRIGDVLEELAAMPPGSADIATLTWLIGYVGCEEIFPSLSRVIRPGGEIGFVAHLDRSPELPFEIFEDLVRENPGVIRKAVLLKFPQESGDVAASLAAAGFEIDYLYDGTFTVVCRDGRGVLDHVMKSGAGSTFYHAIEESQRGRLMEDFVRRVDERSGTSEGIPILHRYVVGTAVRRQ